MDIGVGDGAFVFSAYRRLLQIGADVSRAQKLVYGAEIDGEAYRAFVARACDSGLLFDNVHHRDFFTLRFPRVDAVVGNPPYVRRSRMDSIASIRGVVLNANKDVVEHDLSNLTDLYVYFLLHALERLKPGGRCAVITADSWLTVGYGHVLKKYLQRHFHIDYLITFDRRVFDDAQVKPVLLLATKGRHSQDHDNSRRTYFIRVKNGLAISAIERSVQTEVFDIADIRNTMVKQAKLKAEHSWGIYFKAPALCDQLARHPLMASVSAVAETRIGTQTLAKDFFVLASDQVANTRIEPRYLVPLVQSLQFVNQPVIDANSPTRHYLFYCSKSKEELKGTGALAYILNGETAEVEVRGKGIRVTGYQNKERIQAAGRRNWYDLKTGLERRGRATILIPRLVYKTYMVIWNKELAVPGELFIEFLPFPLAALDDEVYLAILTSSVTEIMLRVNAQVYGGGTYNIAPGQMKNVPILDPTRLTPEQQTRLKQAYSEFLSDPQHRRVGIDATVAAILGLDQGQQEAIGQVLSDLLVIASSAKQKQSASATVVSAR